MTCGKMCSPSSIASAFQTIRSPSVCMACDDEPIFSTLSISAMVRQSSTNNTLPATPVTDNKCIVGVPRWKRTNREGTKFGNNRFGRRGTQRCDQCRKRKIKCIYGNPDSPCEHCRSYNLKHCIKRSGPKAQARLSPSESMSVYDSIPSEDAVSLHYLYSNDTNVLCGSIKLNVLARVLARVYSPAISHSGLRNMMIALLISKSGTRTSKYPTLSEQRHVDITFKELTQKLSNPSEIDEGDIFVSYMLAVWYGDFDSTAIEVHVQGLFAIMRHLSRNKTFLSSPMAPFWALLRDEILWLTRKSANCSRLCRDFRDILGPKTIHQRQEYENELRTAANFRLPAAKVFYGRGMNTSVHTMMESAKIINHRHLYGDSLIESVLVELHVEYKMVEKKHYEDFLDLELSPLQRGEYVENWEQERTIIGRVHDLIVLNVCRLAAISLEAASIQLALRSSNGIVASASLVSILQKTRAFFRAGIRDYRVFGTGIGNSYESYRKYPNWPCKQLIEAILRNAPEEPLVIEAVKILKELSGDFITFQEIYLRRGMDESVMRELEMTCFSPTKVTVEPSMLG